MLVVYSQTESNVDSRPISSIAISIGQNAGHVLSRDQLMESVKGHNSSSFDRSIDVHIGRIRMAIEEDHKTLGGYSPFAAAAAAW